MNENIEQYPAWQNTYRQAQAERDQRTVEQKAKELADKKEQEAKQGVDLASALLHFGIVVEAPPINCVEVEGYGFSLDPNGYRAFKDREKKEYFHFELIVEKRIPGRTEPDDDPVHYRHLTVSTQHLPSILRADEKWDYHLTKLADIFDELDAAVEYTVQRDAERREVALERKHLPVSESDNDKLMKLLRSLIREIVSEELYN